MTSWLVFGLLFSGLMAQPVSMAQAKEQVSTEAEYTKRLTLLKGKRYPVCHAVLEAMNRLKQPALHRYEWAFNDNLLKTPDWKQEPLQKYPDVFAQFYKNALVREKSIQNPSDFSPPSEEITAKLNDAIQEGQALLQSVELDFDNDGYKDQVYRYSEKKLPANSFFEGERIWKYLVYSGNPAGNNLDSQTFLSAFEWDLFLFEGRSFLMIISASSPFVVFEPSYEPTLRVVFEGPSVCSINPVTER